MLFFLVPLEEELDNNKTIIHKLKLFDRFRFMSTSLSKLVYNLSEIYTDKCRDKNCKSECKFKGLKNKTFSYSCNECKTKQLKTINGLIKKFLNTHKFCNNDINKFILLLKKEFILMNTWVAGKDVMKHHSLKKKHFMVNYI